MPTIRDCLAPRLAALLALLAPGAAAAGCKGKGAGAAADTIDGADLERRLAQDLADHDLPATVECPRGRAVARGDVFTCAAAGADGAALAATVTQVDGDGTVAWQWGVTFVDSQRVIDEIKAELRSSDTYTCPRRWLLLRRKGDTATCDVHRAAARGRLVITLEDPDAGTISREIRAD